MFQSWRLKLKEAEVAYKAGRLEEASRLLCQDDLQQFLPAKQLLAKVAADIVSRGVGHLAAGQSSAGWRDLEAAGSLGADYQSLSELRRQLVDHSLAEAERFLSAGNIDGCLTALESLERHKTSTVEVRQLKQAARRVETARRLARQGKFTEAEEAMAEAATIRSRPNDFADAREAYRRKALEARHWQEQLHRAICEEEWTDALTAAEALLELAPQCNAALDGRRRAWNAVGINPAENRTRAQLAVYDGNARFNPAACTMDTPRVAANGSSVEGKGHAGQAGRRFLLWIDGVGGYLVCESSEVLVGQPDGKVDVPILADISRHHARIRREGEGYLLTPLRPVLINGRSVSIVTSLSDGNLLEFGEGVKLRFRRPHPLSATARLEFVSRHRTFPKADGVLLLADSCILGPSENHHVVCHGWSDQVVLYRQGNDLWCRTNQKFDIDSRRQEGQGMLSRNAQVTGHDFSFSLEDVV